MKKRFILEKVFVIIFIAPFALLTCPASEFKEFMKEHEERMNSGTASLVALMKKGEASVYQVGKEKLVSCNGSFIYIDNIEATDNIQITYVRVPKMEFFKCTEGTRIYIENRGQFYTDGKHSFMQKYSNEVTVFKEKFDYKALERLIDSKLFRARTRINQLPSIQAEITKKEDAKKEQELLSSEIEKVRRDLKHISGYDSFPWGTKKALIEKYYKDQGLRVSNSGYEGGKKQGLEVDFGQGDEAIFKFDEKDGLAIVTHSMNADIGTTLLRLIGKYGNAFLTVDNDNFPNLVLQWKIEPGNMRGTLDAKLAFATRPGYKLMESHDRANAAHRNGSFSERGIDAVTMKQMIDAGFDKEGPRLELKFTSNAYTIHLKAEEVKRSMKRTSKRNF